MSDGAEELAVVDAILTRHRIDKANIFLVSKKSTKRRAIAILSSAVEELQYTYCLKLAPPDLAPHERAPRSFWRMEGPTAENLRRLSIP